MACLAGGLRPDEFQCSYGRSRLSFRGPRQCLDGAYVVTLGGALAYGKGVARPYPSLIQEGLGLPVVNLACAHAGPGLYLSDPGVLEVAAGARLALVEVMGAVNQSNPYYTVHPRRNDRFLAATPLLRQLYRDVDFTEIHFTRHLMQVLLSRGATRFAPVAAALKALWLARMQHLLRALPKPRMLIWSANQAPAASAMDPLGHPALVDAAMLRSLSPEVRARAELLPCTGSTSDPVADELDHQSMAVRLAPVLKQVLRN